MSLGLGQMLSLLLCGTALTSEELMSRDTSVPTGNLSQNMSSYAADESLSGAYCMIIKLSLIC